MVVETLVPAGADVHTWQPTPQDVQKVQAAAVVFLNGAGLEEAALPLVRNNATGRVVELAAGLPLQAGPAPAGDHGHDPAPAGAALAEGTAEPGHARGNPADASGAAAAKADQRAEHGGNPHLWLDPRYAQLYVERMRDALSAADPAGAAEYAANAERLIAELQALDAELEQTLGVIPPERRKLVTFHDAFPYFAARYGFELVGVVLRSPGREPSAQEVAELVARIRAERVPAVFTEPQFNARILELAAADSGVRVLTLYSDALDARTATYFDLMRYNARQIVEGLQ